MNTQDFLSLLGAAFICTWRAKHISLHPWRDNVSEVPWESLPRRPCPLPRYPFVSSSGLRAQVTVHNAPAAAAAAAASSSRRARQVV